MSTPTFIILGASLAGANAAEELRKQAFDGHVVLIGSEPERPNECPPLTKDYPRGESEREKVYVHQQGSYEEQGSSCWQTRPPPRSTRVARGSR